MRQIFFAVAGTIAAVALSDATLFASENANEIKQKVASKNTVGIIDMTTTGSVKKPGAVPVFSYQSHIKKDGSLEVQLNEDGLKKGPQNKDVLTVFAPNVRTTEKLLFSQDWYMTIDSNGAMRGIYTVPRGNALPSSVLRNLGEGYGIMKVDPRNSFFKVFPSEYQIASQLTTFSEAARKSVCGDANRPQTLSASMDVKPGWSAAGRIKFNATWNVHDLCLKKKKTK